MMIIVVIRRDNVSALRANAEVIPSYHLNYSIEDIIEE
jgi:hypothetical protein